MCASRLADQTLPICIRLYLAGGGRVAFVALGVGEALGPAQPLAQKSVRLYIAQTAGRTRPRPESTRLLAATAMGKARDDAAAVRVRRVDNTMGLDVNKHALDKRPVLLRAWPRGFWAHAPRLLNAWPLALSCSMTKLAI